MITEESAAVRKLLNSKHHCSPELWRAGIDYLNKIEAALRAYRDGLEAIAVSCPDVPFEHGETTPDGAPTNRRAARDLLASTFDIDAR